MRSQPALRWFWRLYWPASVLFVILLLARPLGPDAEQRFFPIRGISTISDVVRTPQRLCWTWAGHKLRDVGSDNFDVFLDRRSGDRSFPEVFHEDTNIPWRKNGKVAVGAPDHFRYCVLLPPDVTVGEPLTLRQTIHYRGFLGLWDVPYQIPDVTSAGVANP